eukprot:CAMPEP_0118898818 /NCGR_PEP_ID=MMETSP1166-20130328/5652_1 /TAXON_ID=1104430 /ORGANISM="Chrysoreinhardia sp, Strain CCMP3193" /LENGTH=292 /DNA_ID=CAMNT_0006837935 /DNA_START=33 /DNA_END=911 /DNA_ORIENTATION=-
MSGVRALVPLSKVGCMEPWVASSLGEFRAFEGIALELPGDKTTTNKRDPLVLGVMEPRDGSAVARVIAESFASVVVKAEGALTWERAALRGLEAAAKSYEVAEYAVGLGLRCGDRRPDSIQVPDDPSSVVLAVGRQATADVVAAVELRLRDVDGVSPSPLPALDKLMRALLPTTPKPVLATPRPYISNLCVSTRCRRRGVAAALLSAAEFLVGPDVWGYDSVFLHVQKTNDAAKGLYSRADYVPIAYEASDADPLIFQYKPLRPDAPKLDDLRRRLSEQRRQTELALVADPP